ncbi:Transcriptional regulator, LysR family protein [Minicystis rosea]|nr:Transcriptional regulator, LysR family protein [Minicystis rosea]
MAKQSAAARGLDDLHSMAVFARVVETRSFTAAAQALDTTTSSVSKRVARLEERLGVPLIVRTTRSFSPTEAGLLFYERCERILRDVGDAESAVAQLAGSPRGTLRVNALQMVGDMHIAPLLPRFLARYPDLRVELDLSDRKVNIVEEGYDLGIRGMPLGDLADSSLVARRLAGVRTVVCASPGYLAEHGVPRTLDDLVHHECIHCSAIPLQKEWSFTTPEGTRVVPVSGRLSVGNVTALRAAAIGGGGLIRTAAIAVSDALQSGALQAVLEEHASVEFGLYAVYPMGKQTAPKVRAFLDFLMSEIPQRLV